MDSQLDKIFRPKAVAAIGASDKKGSVGYALMKNLIEGGYAGKIFPVNPKHRKIQGFKSYSSIGKIGEEVDLAVIAVPARAVPKVVLECGKSGVGGIVIISAGFKEAGAEGKKMYDQILAYAHTYNMRIVGPNCLGFINPALGLNASFSNRMALPGNLAFISQSGALCTAILDWAEAQSVGFSHFVSIGSMVDVGFHDLIDYLGKDSRTSCILIYMESLTDARKFISAAKAFARFKPIIVLKAGISPAGAKATLSHTGSLAGNNAAYDTAFTRAGVIRVNTIAELFHTAQGVATQPRPKGKNLAIITNAGGPGVLATDYLYQTGGSLAKLSTDTMEALNEILPAAWSHSNPVDVLGDASAISYKKTLEICLADRNVDGVLTVCSPQAVTDPAAIAKEVVNCQIHSGKTILACWMGEQDVNAGREILEAGNIPNYRYPEAAVDVFMKMYHYGNNLKMLHETPSSIPQDLNVDKKAAYELIQSIYKTGRNQLTETEGKQLLSYYGITQDPNKIANSAKEAIEIAKGIGYPVVMKIDSPDIGHKTEVGGVILDIKNPKEVEQGYAKILENVNKHAPEAKINGILLDRMVGKGIELMIGASKDPVFGPLIVFGKGGVEVELWNDTNLGLPPLNMALASQIINRTKIYQLLKGYRGMPGVDLDLLRMILIRFSYLLMDFPEIKEIDMNPYTMDERGGTLLDAHIVLEEKPQRIDNRPYEHLVVSPYPQQYTKKIKLKNGKHVLLRPIRPEDEPLEAEMFNELSKQSLYFRFFGFVPRVSHELLVRFTQIDYDREIAIIAEIEQKHKKRMIGVVRLVHDAWNNKAEFAEVVADAWQGQGLGNEMMDFMLEIAKERGLNTVYASVLHSNKVMVHMFKRRGFSQKSEDFETFYVEKQLNEKEKPELIPA